MNIIHLMAAWHYKINNMKLKGKTKLITEHYLFEKEPFSYQNWRTMNILLALFSVH